MTARKLLEPLLDDGIRSPSFFNGRILSAEDLGRAWTATRRWDRLLGRAIGEGVAEGLDVRASPTGTAQAPVVRVAAGLAITRRGQPLWLANDTELSLVKPASAVVTGRASFGECEPPETGVFLANANVYLLTIAPAQGNEGLAPVGGLGNIAAACNSRSTIDGVQFRLISLQVPSTDLTAGGLLRNRIAYRCFGTNELRQLQAGAINGPIAEYGLIDELRGGRLTECEVPLATLHWTASGLGYVDRWSVRRRLTEGQASVDFPILVGDRRVGEGEAMFLQFEDELLDLLERTPRGQRGGVKAVDHFEFLPPAGILPVGTGGLSEAVFLTGLERTVSGGDHAFLRRLIHDSFYLEPFPVATEPPRVHVFTFAEHPEYVLYLRADRTIPAATPAPSIDVAAGSILVKVSAPGEELPPKSIKEVWAQTTDGKRSEAITTPVSFGDVFFDFANQFGRRTLDFLIPNLDAGNYVVKVSATGFAQGSVAATVPAGVRLPIAVQLHRPARPCPPRYGKIKDVEVIRAKSGASLKDDGGNNYGKVAVMYRYGTTTDQLPAKWQSARRMKTSIEFDQELKWRFDCYLDIEPLAPLLPDYPWEILIDPEYRPKGPIPEEPYAYMTFGDHVYPLILPLAEETLPLGTPASKADIPELTAEAYAQSLNPAGIGDVDVLGAAWSGLVQESLGIGRAAAESIVTETRSEVVAMRDTLAYLPGVTKETGRQIVAQLRTSMNLPGASPELLLANATPAMLEQALGADSLRQAGRLVDQARDIVPAAAWSLGTGGLELSDSVVGQLHERGIDSLGALATTEVDLSGLGLSAEMVTSLKGNAAQGVTRGGVALAPEISLSELGTTTVASREMLAAAGFDSATMVAANPEAVAVALGISAEEARPIVMEAMTVAVATTAGLDRTVAASVVDAVVGATNTVGLGAIVDADVAVFDAPLAGGRMTGADLKVIGGAMRGRFG